MRLKLSNRSLPRPAPAQVVLRTAEDELRDSHAAALRVAKDALQGWYAKGFHNVNKSISKMQIDDNLQVVASIPGWTERKDERNGYVMLISLFDGSRKPMIVILEECWRRKTGKRSGWFTGGLTYRQLHQQIREGLGIEPLVCLRMCPFRPWYRYVQESIPVPESHALPVTDVQCRHLLGTTLLYHVWMAPS